VIVPRPTPKEYSSHWSTADGRAVRLYCGDVCTVLPRLVPWSVQCVVTSPPYWGLRDYQTAAVPWPAITYRPTTDSAPVTVTSWVGHYGAEPAPSLYVAHSVHVLRLLRRALRDDGVIWWNLGDSYPEYRMREGTLDSGNLAGIPWRVALALQADGWILRQDVIWHKLGVMPESVQNRCTKSHEYVFLLTKGTDYYFDNEVIKEGSVDPVKTAQRYKSTFGGKKNEALREIDKVGPGCQTRPIGDREWPGTRNKRSVWSIPRSSYKADHFATFPEQLVETCLLAGTSAKGACDLCGSPWRRIAKRDGSVTIKGASGLPRNRSVRRNRNGISSTLDGGSTGSTSTLGWEPGCQCYLDRENNCLKCGVSWDPERRKGRLDPCQCFASSTKPCLVLDPFVGSGTTAAVCLKLGRHCQGIDLSQEYIKHHAIKRVMDTIQGLPGTGHLLPK
jgi:DNA modification methylase